MFAFRPWTEIMARALLIAVILFNALAPTAVVTEPASLQNDPADSAKAEEAEFVHPTFARPIARVSEPSQALENTALQDSTVLLQCDPISSTFAFVPGMYGSPICPNQSPGISLTETFVKDEGLYSPAGGFVRFRLLCQGGSCEPPDIYYRVSLDATYHDRWPDNPPPTWYAQLNMKAYAHSTMIMTRGMQNAVVCGTGLSGSCHFEIVGVIPKEIISQDPADLTDNYFDFYAAASDACAWYCTVHVEGTIQVSLDPSLLGLQVPGESANCKGGCYYGPSQGFAADPINTNTGAVSYKESDLEIPTSAGPLSFERMYLSSYATKFTSPLGYGWVHNQDLRLVFPQAADSAFVLFKDASGNLYRFWDTGVGRYIPYAGYTASLTKNAGTPVTYTLTDQTQNVYTFDQNGKVTSLVRETGQTITYTYYADGKLQRVSADGGTHYFDFSYNAQGQLQTVTDYTNRSVSFGYDATTGDLISYTDVLNRTWHYEYQNHLLTRILDSNLAQVERNEYYANGKAWKQFDGNDKLVTQLTYNTDGTTTVTDALGKNITHTYDSRGTLTGDANFFGQTQKNYDANFRPTSIQDPLLNPPTLLTWSANGANLEHIKDGLNHETVIAYNSSNQPTSVTDALTYQTKYFYNDPNFPTLPTRMESPLSFDGGVTFAGTDYEYYPPASGASAGKVKFITDALGHKTNYTYTSAGQTASVTTAYGTAGALTTTYAYDNLGRLTDLTDPQGIVTHNEYDSAGHLLKTTRNYVASRPQNDQNKYNLVTEYRYDTRGNQIAVIDTYGVITRTYYDLANRPVTVVQNLVGQTIEAATPPLRGSVSDQNIRTDTVYDDAGNSIATIDPAGVITRTYYDEANRPKLVIQNWAGTDLYGGISTAPLYNPASPDQNVRTESFYDLNGNLIATKDTLGMITRTYYDAINQPVTVVENLTGQDLSVATPPGRGTSSNIRTDTYYDANGNEIATVDPRGIITRTYYDALNRPITVVQNLSGQSIGTATPPAAGVVANIRSDTYYDQSGNVIATVDPRGVITRTYYDASNRPVTAVQNLGGQSIYVATPPARGTTDQNVRTDIAYNQNGRRDSTTNPLGRVTKYDYDELGRLLKTTVNYVNGGVPQNDQNQRNIVTATAYDALSRQIQTTDTLGRITLNVYDHLSRLTGMTQNYLAGQAQNYKDASGNQYNLVTTYAYDVSGNQIAVTDTAGVITRTYYDALARPLTAVHNLVGQSPSIATPPARTNPPSSVANLRTDTVYLGNGTVDSVTDEMGVTTDYTYDPLGRLTTLTDPLSHATTFQYDANGNRTLTTDAKAIATKYEYDALNRLTAVVENFSNLLPPSNQANVRTEYTYDANGNRLSILDGNSHSTSFTYTALGQLQTQADALSHTTTYGYDAMGNRLSLLDANGRTITYGYDELNRLVSINYPALDPDVTFTYDALGRRQSMIDGAGTTTWNYNNLDLPKSIIDPFASTVSYDYDAVGNRTKLTYPGNRVVNYQYDGANRLTTVINGQSALASYQYDAAGRIKTIQRANGVNTLYDYFNNGWLQDITHSSGTTTLASYQYQYDNVGNRIQAIENILFPSLPPPTPTYTPTNTPGGPTATFTPTLTSTPTRTNTPTNTATSTPTPGTQGDLIFADGFESGDLSAWTSSSTASGRLSVTAAAAQVGSQGMQAVITNTVGMFVTDDSPNAEPRYRARFYFDPNSLTMANGDAHYIFKGYAGTSTEVLRVEFRQSAGAYQLRAGAVDNATTWTYTNWFTISDASHYIEFDWRAASAAGATDGGLTLWIDGAQQADLTGIANDTRRMDQVRLGPLSALDAGTSGTAYFDAFESRRTTYIGPVGQVSTATPTSTPAASNTPTNTPIATNTPTATNTPAVTNTPTATNTPGSGMTFVVTKTVDTNDGTCDTDCSLREAVRAANATAGADTILLPAGTYTLSIAGADATAAQGDLDITESVSILGQGTPMNTVVTAAPGLGDRIFEILTSATTVNISNLTVQNGSPSANSGGGLRSTNSALTLNHVIVSANQTTLSGGGIYITGGSLVMSNSAVINNSADYGGGILDDASAVTLTNVTISGNSSNSSGGGLRVINSGTMDLLNVTVSNNVADANADNVGDGGGLYVSAGTVTSRNTVLAGNLDNSTTPIRPDCSATLTSLGHNLIGNTASCTVTATTGDLFGTSGSPINPLLGTLQNNGGNTFTQALLSGSPAIDAADAAACPATDQRAYSRASTCDMGAYEFNGIASTSFKFARYNLNPPPQGGSLTFTATDDTYIYQTNGTTNYGSATSLQTDNSPVKHILLKFTVSGVGSQTVTNAKVRLYNVDPSSKGGDFYRVADNTWQEGTVTWNNAPAADTTLLASLGAVSVGNWYEADLTSLITGDGTYSLSISSTSTDGADYSSKEGTNPPQLVLTLGSGPTSTPTRTPTATPTPSATSTPVVSVTPSLTPTIMPTLPPPPQGPVTITYTYDPLSRLSAADYSTGDYYHYTYDAVGNRLTQATSVLGLPSTTNYVYDNANRLTSVNGVNYTWDANGNLLSDGARTYTYDSANRLKSVAGSTFTYNGLGDRLSQNGVHYTLDLNAGLTQVLADGTNTYLYGVDRIAQVNTGTDYFLGDTLGSVRQLTNNTGTITNASAYDPYGATAQAYGASQTSYGFTGELTDPSGMMYLRSRYYAPRMGRFITRDTWQGDKQNPLTLNAWNYTSSNPINYTDPSGNFSMVCELASPTGWCLVWDEVELFPGGPIILLPKFVPCKTQTQQQLPAKATPTASPTAEPPDNSLHVINVYKGLNGTNPGEFKNFANPDPLKHEPGGYSAYEYLNDGIYNYKLPFVVTYQGKKKSGTKGTVAGIQLASGKTYFNVGVAVYSPELENPAIGQEHWSIFVIEKQITQEELDKLKDALSNYAKDVFGKIKK